MRRLTTGKITSIKIFDGSRWWDVPPPPDIGRFTSFTLTVFVYVETSNTETFRLSPTFIDPKGSRHEVTPKEGTMTTGAYFFEFPLTTGAEAEIGVWSAELTLEYLSEGRWLQLDQWVGEIFNLIVVGEPAAQILAINFTKNFSDWFNVPLTVAPNETYGYRVWFEVFLPEKATLAVELRLIDPAGNTVIKENPSAEFPPGYSQGYAELKIDKFPPTPEGRWLGKATILTIWKGTWVTLAQWDGYVATLQAAAQPEAAPLTAMMVTLPAIALINKMLTIEERWQTQ